MTAAEPPPAHRQLPRAVRPLQAMVRRPAVRRRVTRRRAALPRAAHPQPLRRRQLRRVLHHLVETPAQPLKRDGG